MFIIFIVHVPNNLWASFILARYGWSNAAEIFILCSGYAADIAFGETFLRTEFG